MSQQQSEIPLIYISYAKNDKSWRDRIAEHLASRGFYVPDDLDRAWGANKEAFAQLRRQASVFLLLLSPSYVTSNQISGSEFSEIRSLIALGGRKTVIAVLRPCPWQSFVNVPDARVVPSGSRSFAGVAESEVSRELDFLGREVGEAVRESSIPPPSVAPETETAAESSAEAEGAPDREGDSKEWINQKTFDRFSLDTVEVLSRADRIRAERKARRLHTGHLLQGFREQAAHGDSPRELKEFLQHNEKSLAEVAYNSAALSRDVGPLLKKPPKISENVRNALLTAIEKAGPSGQIEAAHILIGVLSTDTNGRVRQLYKAGMTPEKVPLPKRAEDEASIAEATEEGRVQEEPEESIALGNICDVPAEADALGFKPYVDAIANFLKSEETRPPLTLSIEGEWGSGKSSFMLQLKNAVAGEPLLHRLRNTWKQTEIDGAAKTGKSSTKFGDLWNALWQKRFSVQFNPWRHDKEESLWAAFALEFLRQVSRQRFFPRRWWGTLRLFWAHYSWRNGWLDLARVVVVWIVIVLLVVALPIGVFVYKPHWAQQAAVALNEKLSQQRPQTNFTMPEKPPATEAAKKPEGGGKKPEEEKKDNFDVVLRVLLLAGGNAAYFAVVLTIWLKAKELVGNPLEIDLKKYLKSPDYEGRVAFVEQFHEDFRKIVDSYAGDGRVYVFVDDLDRCEVPKAAELIKAVNLLIADDPRLIFILGMDREKVAAGLAVKYEKLLPYLLAGSPAAGEEAGWKRRGGLEFGQTFLQKFIQLPFRVPGPNIETYAEFIGTISGALAPIRFEKSSLQVKAREFVSPQSPPGELKAEQHTAEEVGEEIRPSMPRSRRPTAEEAEKRRERELQFRGDSPKFQAAAMMYAQTLGTNPRRLIQFINLLRLQAYIVNGIGFFDQGVDKGTPITVAQLGKFVAISLRWPALLADYAAQPGLLGDLEDYANGKTGTEIAPGTSTIPTVTKSWLDEKGMYKFLRYGMLEQEKQNYTLKNATLYRLLSICPQRIQAPRPVQKVIATIS